MDYWKIFFVIVAFVVIAVFLDKVLNKENNG